jgi:hypothetical protein
MRLFRRDRCEPMPARFHELAAYNARVWHGIAHTPEMQERMRLLQADFDAWQASTRPNNAVTVVSGPRLPLELGPR